MINEVEGHNIREVEERQDVFVVRERTGHGSESDKEDGSQEKEGERNGGGVGVNGLIS